MTATSFSRTIPRAKGFALMTSAPVRDPFADHLLTPQNAALLLIDYQPSQLAGVRSMDRDLLVRTPSRRCGPSRPSRSRSSTRPSTSPPGEDSPRCLNSQACWPTTSRSTGPRPTPGRTPNSSRPSAPPAAASSSSALSGRKSAWPSPPSTRCATDTRSTPSSTRSAAPRPRPTGPAWTVSTQAGGQPVSWVSLAVELQRDWARQEHRPVDHRDRPHRPPAEGAIVPRCTIRPIRLRRFHAWR